MHAMSCIQNEYMECIQVAENMISLYYYPCYWNDFAVANGSDSLYEY